MRRPIPLPRPKQVPDEIVEAFRAVAPTLEEFARQNGLLIERYRRGKSAWEFSFARRIGGQAALVVTYREQTGHVLDISALWWLDDFAGRTRRLRSEKIAVYDRRSAAPELRRQLEAGLQRIDGWTLEDLGPPFGPFRDWATSTADSLAEARNQLPLR